jgi:acyl-CoA synthetase (AMP-forming)/AMP-acid ligase II
MHGGVTASVSVQDFRYSRGNSVYRRDRMIAHFIDHSLQHILARDPDRAALVCGADVVTYRDLERRMRQVAHNLQKLNLVPGARIAWLGQNSPEYAELLLGAAAAQMVLVPVNWRLAPPELRALLEDARPAIAFCESQLAPLLQASQPPEPIPTLSFGGAGAEYQRWLASSAPSTSRGELLDPRDRSVEDCFLQLYTSGTTGRPKGVCLSHRAISARRAQEAALGAYYAWDDHEVMLIGAPMFHIGGSGQLLQGLHHGATCVIHTRLDPQPILEALARHRVRRLFAPPVVLRKMIDCLRESDLDVSSLRLFTCGSAPVTPALLRDAVQALPLCGFIHAYGMTEMAGAQVFMAPEEVRGADSRRLLSCGRAAPGVELRIVGPTGATLSEGVVGEVQLRSAARMSGYWNQPEQTESALQDGWYRTGDAGSLDNEGFLYIVDRIKDMIVTGGENVYPAEVENALHEHPAIAAVAVIGRPHELWGESPHAVIILNQGARASAEELIAFLRARIAGYKIPRTYDFVSQLPLTSSGKISKVELRKRYWSQETRGVH